MSSDENIVLSLSSDEDEEEVLRQQLQQLIIIAFAAYVEECKKWII